MPHKKIIYSILGCFVVGIISVTFVRAFIATDFSFTGTGHTSAFAGDSNILLADFTGPSPATDTILLDGAAADPVAGDPLSSFAASIVFLDTDGAAGFGGGEPVISSANAALTSADTVLTSSTITVLNAFPTIESGQTLYGFVDTDTDTILDGNEDIVHQVISGNAETLTSGDALRIVAPSDDMFYVADSGTSTYDALTPNAILHYLGPSENPYAVVQAGTLNFHPATLADNICVEDSDSSGTISSGDDFWRDLNGTDCTSFDTGIDVIVNGEAGIMDLIFYELNGYEPSSGYGPVTPGYIDGNGNGLYDCTRTSCEAFVVAAGNVGVDGVFTGGLVANPSPVLVDGVGAIATDWVDDPTLMNAYDLSTVTIGGETRFAYVDSDADTIYDSAEDMVELVKSGNAETFSTGDLFLNMTNAGWFADINNNDTYSVVTDIMIGSLDANLNAGALNGTGVDEVVIPSNNATDLSTFDVDDVYFDADANVAYTDGEDIVADVDASGYFNADDLMSISFSNTVSDYPLENADLEHLYVYKKAGADCAGSGTDSLLGDLAASPFFSTAITITDSLFTAQTSYCVYADIAAGARAGRYVSLAIPQNGATFLGAVDSPSDALFSMGNSSSYTSVSRLMSATMVPGDVAANATTTYTTVFTTSADITTGDDINIVFPSAYDVTGASVVCTDDGGASAGTSSINGQIVSRNLSADIAAGSLVSCVVSGVVNPETAGAYSAFIVSTVRQAIYDSIRADVDLTFSAVTITASTIRHNRQQIVDPIVAPVVTITTPANGVFIQGAVMITWETTGTSPGFANITYTANGIDYAIARNISDSGHYLWSIPSRLIGQAVDIEVALTDLSSVQTDDLVSVLIGEDGIEEEIISEEDLDSKWYMPDIGTRLVKIPESPIVYYVGYDHRLLRPFLTEDIFFSWRSNFDKVRTPEPVELAQFPMGAPMPPMPGTYFIKSPTSPKVYVLEPIKTNKTQPILHWIASEEVAELYFGGNWSARVLDVPAEVIDLSPKGYDLLGTEEEPWFIAIY